MFRVRIARSLRSHCVWVGIQDAGSLFGLLALLGARVAERGVSPFCRSFRIARLSNNFAENVQQSVGRARNRRSCLEITASPGPASGDMAGYYAFVVRRYRKSGIS